MNYFHSNRKELKKGTLPEDFLDSFPIMAVHDSPAMLILRDARSVGCLIKLKNANPTCLERTVRVIASWLSSSQKPSKSMGITATIYRKNEVSDLGNDTVCFTTTAAISLVVEYSKKDEEKKGTNLIETLSTSSVKFLEHPMECLVDAANELLKKLRLESINAGYVTDNSETIALSRRIWRQSCPDTKINLIDGLGGLASYFAEDLDFSPGRVFWREGEWLRMAFMARTAHGDDDAYGEDLIHGISESVRRISELKEAGLFCVALSRGGRVSPDPSKAILSTDSDNSSVKGPHTRLSMVYIPSHEWNDDVDGFIGSLKESSFLNRMERQTVENLWLQSRGLQWTLVDTQWLEVLYAIYPGACCLGSPEGVDSFDVCHIEDEKQESSVKPVIGSKT